VTVKVGKVKFGMPVLKEPVSYEALDRPTLERLAAYHREQLRRIEAEIIKHRD
jgi:hypothetical protein